MKPGCGRIVAKEEMRGLVLARVGLFCAASGGRSCSGNILDGQTLKLW